MNGLFVVSVDVILSSSCFAKHDHLTRPLRSGPITSLHRYYGAIRPSPLLRYSRLAVLAACASPFTSGDWFLQFRAKACVQLAPPIRRPPSAQSSGSPRTYLRRKKRPWFWRHL